MAKKQTQQSDAEDAIVVENETESQIDPDFPEVEPPPAAELRDVFAEEKPEIAERTSIGRMLLNAMIIFLIGAVAALWAGPKLAPNLPSGLAPVARWLTPGQDAALVALEAAKVDLTARIDALPSGIDEAAVGALVDTRLDAFDSTIDGRIAAQVTDKSADVQSRLSALDVQISGLVAELAALQSQPLAEGAAPASGDVARLAARIDGLQARVNEMAGQYAALVKQVEGVSTLASQKIANSVEEVAAAQSEAAVVVQSAALVALKSAALSGSPFDGELAAFGQPVPAIVSENAVAGLPSILALRESFPQLAHEAIRAAVIADGGEGLTAGVGAFLKAQVATRSLTPQAGTSADAVLSRVEDALRSENLANVLSEGKALPEAAMNIMAGWLAQVETRVAVTAALAQLEAGE